jgi:molybdopterin-guanine dinucleotide biosynthesis protein A
MKTAGIVLCGGRSSRMGRAKALLPWGGQTLIANAVEILHRCVDEVVVVGSTDIELPSLDAVVVRDREPGRGPLSGIREGLEHMSADLAFVCGTDTPLLSPLFVKTLLGFGGAAAPEIDQRIQTLCAVYPRSALAEATRLLAEDRLRPLFLLEAAGYRKVSADELPDLDSLRGFNTPAAYLSAVRHFFAEATCTLELLGRARRAAGRAAIDVPVGTLAEVCAHAEPAVTVCTGDRIAREFLVSLDGRDFVRDPNMPVGPGERLVVMDASVGG